MCVSPFHFFIFLNNKTALAFFSLGGSVSGVMD